MIYDEVIDDMIAASHTALDKSAFLNKAHEYYISLIAGNVYYWEDHQ